MNKFLCNYYLYFVQDSQITRLQDQTNFDNYFKKLFSLLEYMR